MDELYLIPKVVEKTKLSDATVRRYAKEYIDYLPHKEIAGKIYFFTDALMIFQQIFNMKNRQNLDDVIIKKKLEAEHGRCVDVVEENQQIVKQEPNVSADLFAKLVELLDQKQEINQLRQENSDLMRRMDRIDERDSKVMEFIREKQKERESMVQRAKRAVEKLFGK